MNYLFIQNILAGGRNSEGLVDILIIVFFAVIWIIRSLFMSQKEQTQQKKPLTRKPPARNSINKDRVEKFLENILQPKGPSKGQKNRQSAQKSYIKESASSKNQFDRKQTILPQYKRKKTTFAEKSILDTPQLQELPEFADNSINNLETVHLIKQKDTTSSNYLSENLFDKADPDELKKAILYSEILGKPLSIREISD